MTDLSAFVTDCPDCRQPILWPFTKGGTTRMPVDAAPAANGNVLIVVDPTNPKRITCDVIGNRANRSRLRSGGWLLYLHHRLTCTKAEKWARPETRRKPAASTTEGLF